jgi:hypothetical protein
MFFFCWYIYNENWSFLESFKIVYDSQTFSTWITYFNLVGVGKRFKVQQHFFEVILRLASECQNEFTFPRQKKKVSFYIYRITEKLIVYIWYIIRCVLPLTTIILSPTIKHSLKVTFLSRTSRSEAQKLTSSLH